MVRRKKVKEGEEWVVTSGGLKGDFLRVRKDIE